MGNRARRALADSVYASRIVTIQLAVTLAAALLLALVGWVHAGSGLLGGLIAVAGNALFAMRIFDRYRAQEPGRLLGRFYGAELQKLLLTGVLFAGSIILVHPLSAGALFGVFLLVQMAPVVIVNFL